MFRRELSYKELETLNRTLYFYSRSGYSFEKSLRIIKEKRGFSINIKSVVKNMLKEINKGKSIYASFSTTNKIPNYMLNIIRVGEETGRLENSFKELWKYYSWRRKSKKELMDNIAYPISILILSISLFLVIILYFIPEISGLMESISNGANSSINKMMSINKILRNYGHYIAFGFFSLIIVIIYFINNNKKFLYIILNKTPIIKSLYLKSFNINFFNSIYVIISNGINLTEGLNILISAEKNYFIEQKLSIAVEEIKKGSSLFKALDNTKLFSEEDLGFIITGEESGELEENFKTIAKLKEEEFKSDINIILKCIQPIMIITLGFMIFNIIYSSVIPVIDMMGKIQ